MNWLVDVVAVLLVSVVSLQIGLFLAWTLLTLLMNSLGLAGIPTKKVSSRFG
jgi:hypothetical protein